MEMEKHKDQVNEPPPSSLFLGKLSETTTPETIREYFSKYGEITSVHVIKDWKTNKSKRCAIMSVKSKTVIKNIFKHKPHSIDGSSIRIALADESKKGHKSILESELFIGKIPFNVSLGSLSQYFGQFGNVDFVHPLYHCLAQHKDIYQAYIRFSSPESGSKILNKPTPHRIGESCLSVSPYKEGKCSDIDKIVIELSKKGLNTYYSQCLVSEFSELTSKTLGNNTMSSKQAIKFLLEKYSSFLEGVVYYQAHCQAPYGTQPRYAYSGPAVNYDVQHFLLEESPQVLPQNTYSESLQFDKIWKRNKLGERRQQRLHTQGDSSDSIGDEEEPLGVGETPIKPRDENLAQLFGQARTLELSVRAKGEASDNEEDELLKEAIYFSNTNCL